MLRLFMFQPLDCRGEGTSIRFCVESSYCRRWASIIQEVFTLSSCTNSSLHVADDLQDVGLVGGLLVVAKDNGCGGAAASEKK